MFIDIAQINFPLTLVFETNHSTVDGGTMHLHIVIREPLGTADSRLSTAPLTPLRCTVKGT